MHLLAAQSATIDDGSTAIDLGQTPGEIVVLSAADSDLTCLAAAQARCGGPTLRLASLLQLTHHYSVDLHAERVLSKAKLIVVRLLGGRGAWRYGVDCLASLCRERAIGLALLPGDDRADPELTQLSTVSAAAQTRLWRYLAEGGVENAEQFLGFAASLLGLDRDWREPVPLLRGGYYRPPAARGSQPVAAILFYRALVQAGNTAPIDALIDALAARGLTPLPFFVQSLRDPQSAALLEEALARSPPDIIFNATGFAVSTPGMAHQEGPLAASDCPVLQIIFAGSDETQWRAGKRGLDPRDLAMNVALPEVDGRIITRALSFKGERRRDPLTEADLQRYVPVPDRVAFVADLASHWVRLRRTPPGERRIALILANYPNRDGRIGNGVGLDTPAAVIEVLKALKGAGYRVEEPPGDGDRLIRRLLSGPTNAVPGREAAEGLSLADYSSFFSRLPPALQAEVRARWGAPEEDPFFRPGRLDCGRFALPALSLGAVTVAVQPSRGYHLDPKASFHDPDLVPPHNYFAFYAWLREDFRAHAIIHMGKHGTLEWLPGKAVALSAECFPEAVLGPMPLLYPFIVNDPGEGTQAKRRAQSVIIDHLTPPLARAEIYGRLAELERLVDEYYQASGQDPRRLTTLTGQILDLARATGLDRDCGIGGAETAASALGKLDAWLCDVKEMQIRDGLHIFGRAPEGASLTGLLVALARLPRGQDPHQASLLRALAEDLELGADPLAFDLGLPWEGPRPAALEGQGPWRSQGDTVERLEQLAHDLVAGVKAPDPAWVRSRAVLDWIAHTLRPSVIGCARAEIEGLLKGLDGRFVPPEPSGAPSRGRPDVLPTGRNFYSVDTRAVPTQAAWALGWKSAHALLERHTQDHGAYPKRLALSAWGTATMRTGGDDIAQALALMGVRPLWETVSGRVTGFEILPPSLLDRPRIDVTLRVSGFFRDAFPALIDLVDSAARAVAALDEPPAINPLAERVRLDRAALEAQGMGTADAQRRAGYRVFGSKPGAYGAGLQALIDEGGWRDERDLADAYLAWSGFAYGAGAEGVAAHDSFRARLQEVELVVHNQDNREHDLLDSDDYYQFEGGLAVAIRAASGVAPAVYHMDHSRPETPRARTLQEEIARVVHGRAVNPKWIKGVMRHGYKGGFEMAASVDYLFAFAATARAVEDHHFDAVFEAYLEDAEVSGFLEAHNPDALHEIARS